MCACRSFFSIHSHIFTQTYIRCLFNKFCCYYAYFQIFTHKYETSSFEYYGSSQRGKRWLQSNKALPIIPNHSQSLPIIANHWKSLPIINNQEFSDIDLSEMAVFSLSALLCCGVEAFLVWENVDSLAWLIHTKYKMIFIFKPLLLIYSSWDVFCIATDDFIANLSWKVVFGFFGSKSSHR